MLLESQAPISEPYARTVEPAVTAILRLGITQQEVVEDLSRVLGIVRCVLDFHQSIPREKLTGLRRTLWSRLRHIPDIPPETADRVRSIILKCTVELHRLAESADPAAAEATPHIEEDTSRSNEPPQLPDRGHRQAEGDRPRRTRDLFGLPIAAGSAPNVFGRRNDDAPRPWRGRPPPPRGQLTLFNTVPSGPSVTEPGPLAPVQEPQPLPPTSETASVQHVPNIFTARVEQPSRPAPIVIASGEKAKARDILAAVHVLKTVDREKRPATTEERQTLARFAGFGPVALSIFPDPVTGRYKDASWQEVGEELATLLTPEEYASAKRTTFNAFYTSPTVITAMHEGLARLGVAGDATVLEPGCGCGNFLELAPEGMRFIGVELDRVSGRIAQLRHPGQDIRVENFRDTNLPEGSIDGVIGNVPFADVKLEYRGQKLSLHDYFLAKSVDALRPDGALALVTTHFTLDKQNAAIREYLGSKADFVGAIRLPSDAFKREGTAVVTDIVFLRKRAPGESARHEEAEWQRAMPFEIEGVEVLINRYFVRHPEMVLGNWSRKDTLYDEGYSVVGTGDLAAELRAAIGRLPEFATSPSAVLAEPPPTCTPPPPERHIGEGSFFVADDGTICQFIDGRASPVVYSGTQLRARGTHTGKRLAGLIGLRDLARRVLQSQNDGWPEAQRSEARRELNWAYDRFTGAYGPINKTTFGETKGGGVIRRMSNLVKFREDPDAMLVMSLEDYDESTGMAAKAAILTKDVVGRTPPVTSVKSAEEGLLVSLNQHGTVDLPFMAALYGKSEPEIIGELDDLVFRDPETETWQTADAYLSGDVRAKLAAVLGGDPKHSRNAAALQEVQPEDVLPGDIDANLGAPWIPTSDVHAFAAELFHVEPDALEVSYLPKDAMWSFDAGYAATASVAATSEFGTARANGTWLLTLALNMKSPVIYDTVMDGDRETKVVNQEATLAAREKQRQIKERFRSWVFTDPERTERLVRLYNDTYNNLRPRLFEGSHLDFPGMNQTIQLMAHQRDAIWRCMCAGNTLLAQAVGAGKTYIMAAAGMKLRQANLVKKPLYVVPNHMLEQFGREFLQLYPNAKLLVAGKEDLSRERRKHLTAKIASGEWDGIIVTHSSFERIGMSREYQAEFLRQQIEEYERLLVGAAGADAGRARRNLIKTIEKQKARHEERLQELLAKDKKDDGLVFDDLGIDHLFIDEAQYYKNLETPTKMERVAGIQSAGSERAFDLFLKTRYLHRLSPGRGVTFATGTPISNTMVEMYTLCAAAHNVYYVA